jgi:hypothetical protein
MKDNRVALGFQHPMRRDRELKKRGNTFAGLITGIALLFSIVVAVTAVSIGIARAGALAAAAEGESNPLALAAFLGLIFAGMGGITAAIAMRDPRRD